MAKRQGIKNSEAFSGSALIPNIKKKLKGRYSKQGFKKIILMELPYIFVFLTANRGSCLYRISPGENVSNKIMYLFSHTEKILGLLPSFELKDIAIGAVSAVAVKLILWQKQQDRKKLRKGEEYGSARWGNAEDIRPYQSDAPWMNIPLTATESLTMESRPPDPKYARNKNILVIGGSGSGKTRFFVKPSVMQMNCSYVLTDPKGSLIEEVGSMLARGPVRRDKHGRIVKDKNGKPVHEPYVIKVLNTINFKKSLHYNPFAYLKSEKDILKLVTVIMENTKGDGEKETQDFWYKAERLLYTALIAFIWYEGLEEEKNFSTLLDLLNESEVKEEDEDYKNPVDLLFEELEERDPEHFAVRQYKKYKLAAGFISLKRLLNHHFLRNWSSKMIKKSLEAYFLPKTQNCTFLKTFSKDGNILPRQSGYSVRSFSNRHKNPEKFKKVTLLPCKTASERWVK